MVVARVDDRREPGNVRYPLWHIRGSHANPHDDLVRLDRHNLPAHLLVGLLSEIWQTVDNLRHGRDGVDYSPGRLAPSPYSQGKCSISSGSCSWWRMIPM